MSKIIITAPGVYDIPKARYHEDPVEAISLSCSIAKLLRTKSPVHAWKAHPRLNPKWEPTNGEKHLDKGDVAHQLILGDVENFRVIDPAKHLNKDGGIPAGYTNAAMKEARARAYLDGQTPILPEDFKDAQAMVKSLRAQLDIHEDASIAFTHGKPEQTYVWTEKHRGIDIWFRIRVDWDPEDANYYDDYKSTTDASPAFWADRQIFNMDYDFAAAFYRRGIRAVHGIENPKFRFIVQENEAPYAACVYEPVGPVLDLAEKEVNRAIDAWAWCRANGAWPGYPNHTILVGAAPVYHEKRILDRDEFYEYARENKIDLFKKMLAWQAPLEDDGERL